ncbi:hypothetical protein [Neisseria meningitidis]|nr:hypothetical protein [Neisseria meningitidis]
MLIHYIKAAATGGPQTKWRKDSLLYLWKMPSEPVFRRHETFAIT